MFEIRLSDRVGDPVCTLWEGSLDRTLTGFDLWLRSQVADLSPFNLPTYRYVV